MKILVVMPTNEEHREKLKSHAPSAEWIFTSPAEVSDEDALSADIIIGNIPPKRIKDSANLKWIQLNSAGMDGYLGEGAIPSDTILTNATGAYGLAISEHMMGMLLHLMKKINLYSADDKEHKWVDHGPVTSIYGSRTLVVGCGDIGGEFAKRMNAFGSSVTGIRRNIKNVPEYVEKMCSPEELIKCLGDADVVASCLPGGPETYHLYNKDTFAAMKEGTYFINIGRGGSVDQEALADALNSGHLAGAAIDVTDPEPLPENHILWNAKNLLITPHVSGGYHLQETHDRIIGIACRNLDLFLKNELTGVKKF